MTIYSVGDKELTSPTEAKKEVGRTGKSGSKTKVWANGDLKNR